MIESTLRRHLLRLAVGLARARKVKLSTVSRELAGDSDFFDALRAKKKIARGTVSFTVRLFDRIVRKARARWPETRGLPKIEIREFYEPATGARHGKAKDRGKAKGASEAATQTED